MKKTIFSFLFFAILFFFIFLQFECSQNEPKKEMTKAEMIQRGKYLVNLGGCNDCHSPKIMTNMGPVPDTTKLLSGQPAGEPLPSFDPKMVTSGSWVLASAKNFTAFVGPWGISFAKNLTPDNETGLGRWTPDLFIKALRSGKDMGVGRPILPPMPWPAIGQLPDEDLKCIFAYLQSLPAISNKVPDPIPPDMMADQSKMIHKKGKS
jgi:hypothetical protein